MADQVPINQRIRERRRALGWSLEEVAARAHVSKSTVVNIENGARARPYRLRDVLVALGMHDEDEQTVAEIQRVRDALTAGGLAPEVAEKAARIVVEEQQRPGGRRHNNPDPT